MEQTLKVEQPSDPRIMDSQIQRIDRDREAPLSTEAVFFLVSFVIGAIFLSLAIVYIVRYDEANVLPVYRCISVGRNESTLGYFNYSCRENANITATPFVAQSLDAPTGPVMYLITGCDRSKQELFSNRPECGSSEHKLFIGFIFVGVTLVGTVLFFGFSNFYARFCVD